MPPAILGDPELLALLVCPRDKLKLEHQGAHLICPQGHRYAVIEGVPILLVSDAQQTHIEGDRALAVAESGDTSAMPNFEIRPNQVDQFVRNWIGATNGGLYKHLVGSLTEYPIPRLRLGPGDNRLFLEIGCNWGRWCISAARLGYRVVGVDPSLRSIRAAYRVAKQLGVEATYIVADARYLPFKDQSIDQVFSYSVLQHLSKSDVGAVLAEIRRALRPKGESLVQMANAYGVRCLYHQIRRGFRETRDFEVRYWRPAELLKAFEGAIGPSQLSVDGFFSLNIQPSDLHLLPAQYRLLVRTSEGLRSMVSVLPILRNVADSIYVSSVRPT